MQLTLKCNNNSRTVNLRLQSYKRLRNTVEFDLTKQCQVYSDKPSSILCCPLGSDFQMLDRLYSKKTNKFDWKITYI